MNILMELIEIIFQDGLSADQIPESILTWPAKDNPWLNEFAPKEEMAPFHDYNNDGRYDPLDGDLPIALKENPDFLPLQMRFTVYNDLTMHNVSQSQPVYMEFHQLDYLLACDLVPELDNVVFTRLKYIYKGEDRLTDFRLYGTIQIWAVEIMI